MENIDGNSGEIVNGSDAAEKIAQRPERVISNFWRRIFAYGIDFAILGALGLLLGMFFSTYFQSIGGLGRFIGLGIALVYFGVLNSGIAGGQTPGKRMLGIMVVDKNGKPINPPLSFLRSFILLTPYFMNGLSLPCGVGMNYFVAGLLFFVVFGMGLTIIYLYLFNAKTRQSLHDLAAGTYVVYSPAPADLGGYVTPKKHLVIGGILLFALPAAGIIFFNPITTFAAQAINKNGSWDDLMALTNRVMEHEPCIVTGVMINTSTTISSESGQKASRTKTDYISVNAFLTKQGDDKDAVAGRIAKFVAKEYKGIKNIDEIRVRVTSGYDIGIASVSESRVGDFNTKGEEEK